MHICEILETKYMKTKSYTLSDFYTDVEKCKLREMTTEETELLLHLYTSKENPNIPEKNKPFLFKLIEKRLSIYSFTITDVRLIFFLCSISQTPGKAVMYLTYLDYWCKKQDVKVLTFDYFCQKTFPYGFPDFDNSDIWEKFKTIGTDK